VIDLNKLKSEFIARYDRAPRIFRAPGRVNLIGEHTDYNDGFVLPCAIDFATYVAASVRDDRKIRVASLNFEGEIEVDLDDTAQPPAANWTKYVQGVALSLEAAGYRLKGADLLIDSDIPIGAGLSSSAALEVSASLALVSLSGHKIDGMELAKIGQAAEHKYAGVLSGIMDQFASVFGKAGHALFLDCRSLEWSVVPVSSAEFVICNTKVKHDLAESEYNRRRAECLAAAEFFGKTSLRDVSREEIEERWDEMPKTLRKRAMHVVSENERVIRVVEALKRDDLNMVGMWINESHESLTGRYEVSSRELGIMADIARMQPGVLGARMMGGGFGGCTINLVHGLDYKEFVEKVCEAYHQMTGIVPEIYLCRVSDGASEISDPGNR
jgi:galactokinase